MTYLRGRRLLLVTLAAVVIAFAVYLLAQSLTQEVETQSQSGQQEPSPPAAGAEPSFPSPENAEFVSGRILVQPRGEVPEQALEAINRQNGARTNRVIPGTQVRVIQLPRELPVTEAVRRYEASPDVEYAEPDFLFFPERTPNDPDYGKLYGLHNTGQTGGSSDADIDAPEAWDTTTGGPATTVAVIDEGVDIGHPDLKDNVWVNPDEIPGNNIDDDKNGYVDDVNGWDFYRNDASVYDAEDGDKHGTHVAGTIAAAGDNGVGVTGVTWQAKVMPLKFLGPTGGSTSDAVEAINYALREGVKISNNSWGGEGSSQALLDAIRKADTAGHLFVAAAGNGGSDGVGDDNDTSPHYPSNYNSANIIAVAATNNSDALAKFSNYGSTNVDLAAPGVGILSTLPGNAYGSYNGTSMATPHVAGVAALIKAQYPTLDDEGIKARILESVDEKSGLTGKTVTGGRLNAAGALAAGSSSPVSTAPTVTSVKPAEGATGVRRASNVTATFSEEMDPASLTDQTVTLVRAGTTTPIAATVSCDDPCQTVELDPDSRLGKRKKYTARIEGGTEGVKTTADVPLAADKTWSFTTGRR